MDIKLEIVNENNKETVKYYTKKNDVWQETEIDFRTLHKILRKVLQNSREADRVKRFNDRHLMNKEK